MRSRISEGLAIGVLLAGLVGVATAAPVLTLPKEMGDLQINQMRKLIAAQEQAKSDPEKATPLAAFYLGAARYASLPHYLGPSLAVLNHVPRTSWTSQMHEIAGDIWLQRQDLVNAAQHYISAQSKDPNQRVSIINALVNRNLGQMDQARHACKAKVSSTTSICMTMLNVWQDPQGSAKKLESMRPMLPKKPNELGSLYHQSVGEAYADSDDFSKAQSHLFRATQLDASNHAARLRLIDLMTKKGRYKQMERLTHGFMGDIRYEIRATIAANKQLLATTADLQKSVDDKLQKEVATGTAIQIGRSITMYYLELRKDPNLALSFAIDNWSMRKTPVDARLLLEAAVRSKKVLSEASSAAAWLKSQTKVDEETKRIIHLYEQIQEN